MLRVVAALLLLVVVAGNCEALRIAAFNIQVFGTSKLSNTEVVATLSKVVQQYDIVLIQEIRDISESVIPSFLNTVNQDRLTEELYAVETSVRLGRSVSKEQYAFMYRQDRVEVLYIFQYNDTANDSFEREPYSVQFRSKGNTDLPDFFLMGIHIRPSDAVNEINALVGAYDEAALFFSDMNGVILGDFNADCSYVSQTQFDMLELVTDQRFTWLIDSSTDTTVASTPCAYDRIVVAGEILTHVVPNSSMVFRFDEECGLTQEQTMAVSDHFPVEFEFKGTVVLSSDNGTNNTNNGTNNTNNGNNGNGTNNTDSGTSRNIFTMAILAITVATVYMAV